MLGGDRRPSRETGRSAARTPAVGRRRAATNAASALQRKAGNRGTAALLQRQVDQSESYIAGADENRSLVPRGEIDTEVILGTKYVHVYQTVYASVESGSWKDVQQTAGGQIVIKGTGDMWLNAGRPWRAFHYVRTYLAQAPKKAAEDVDKEAKAKAEKGQVLTSQERAAIEARHGRPVIRSFLLPYATYLEITSAAIAEKQKAEYGPLNFSVDKSKDTDQFLIRHDDVKKIKASAKQHSLVSYVLPNLVGEFAKHSHHGTVRSISELLESLGMPLDLQDRLLLPLDAENEMQKDSLQIAHAEKLNRLHALSFELDKKVHDMQRLADLTHLSRELLGTAVWPVQPARRAAQRERIARAATYALMPSLLRENFDEAAAHMHGADVTTAGTPVSPWMKKQVFKTVAIAKYIPPPPKDYSVQRAAAELRAAAKLEAQRVEAEAAKAKAGTTADEESVPDFTLFG